jgi:5-methylcytosine-specific restriction enzyme subunit McrC
MQNIHRGMEHYEMPLKFAEIFLNNQSFTPIRGTNHAFSLLFQMNIIFERYVTKLLEKCKDVKNLVISMKGKYNLLQSENKNRVWIEPDYLINDKNIVGDAKWKLIEKDDGDIKISPNDVYQVHSYLHYFGSNIGYIFTPRLSLDTDEKQKIDKYTFQTYNDSSKKLYIYYVGLEENSTIELKSI